MRVARASAVLLALVASTSAAYADTGSCIAASEKGQQLRDQQKLLAAREELIACSREECPKPVKKDCTELLEDVVRRIPSIVLRVKDPKGEDVIDASVAIDGKTVASHLDGRPITLDPGAHDVRIEGQGRSSVATRILAVQGEHERLMTLELGAPTGLEPPAERRSSARRSWATHGRNRGQRRGCSRIEPGNDAARLPFRQQIQVAAVEDLPRS